jgi:glycosyltransferase involved in cell wall biosynthesis
MRILSITAGAAGMYCGSCFRDNALARELLARGHEVTLLPVYTPTRTDEPNVSRNRVLFGGISVYLQQHSALFRRTPWLLDRVWDAPAVIKAFANRAVSTDARVLGDMTISMLQGTDGVLRKEFDKLVEWVRNEPLPDIVNLPNSLLVGMAGPLGDALERPVCCTLQGEELFLNGLTAPYRDRAVALIREQARRVDRFIAVSRYCATFMSELLEIPPARVDVVPLGIRMDGYERHDGSGDVFRVGYFARVAPEKGLHVLADAYVRFRRRTGAASARLEAAGYLGRAHESYLGEVHQVLQRSGLGDEFRYGGAVDREGKLRFLRGLDVLSVPATYDEPKGMFLLEAMASGVPVVQPRRGGFVEIVEKTGGGLLVDPNGPDALADALYRLWNDRSLLGTLSSRAVEGVRAHYTIEQSATRLLDVYATMVKSESPVRTSVA